MDNLDKLELMIGQLKELPIAIQIKKTLDKKQGILSIDETNILAKANEMVNYATSLLDNSKLDLVVDKHKVDLLNQKQEFEKNIVSISAEITKIEQASAEVVKK